MSKNIMNDFKKSIKFAKKYCTKNRLTLVQIIVPPSVYIMLRSGLRDKKSLAIGKEKMYDVPINLNINIKKPQYIMEMNSDD